MPNRSHFFIGLTLATLLLASCGNNNSQVATIEITGSPDPLRPRESKQLTAIAKDANGNVLNNVSFTWSSSNDRFVTIVTNADPGMSGTVSALALYPFVSPITITARIGNIRGVFIQEEGIVPLNNGNVMKLTENTVQDNWGGTNNTWPTTSRDQVLWAESNGTTTDVLLGDIDGNMVPLKTGILTDVDFMALGSAGLLSEEVLASWRENASLTFVSDGSALPDNLGAVMQEENSVADGCLFFHEGAPNNDIQRFTEAEGLNDVFTTGNSLGPVLGSACQAVWLQQNGSLVDIDFFNGNGVTTLVSSLNGTVRFDFRLGMLVYSAVPTGGSNSDIFLIDTTSSNPQAVNITNSPNDVENFAKTDGNSILIHRIANGITNQIILYDIASATEQIISTNTTPKDGDSLQIDFKQAIWTEGSTNLFFHDGSGLASGTSPILLPAPLNTDFHPYIADGTVAWVGNDGDDEIYILK